MFQSKAWCIYWLNRMGNIHEKQENYLTSTGSIETTAMKILFQAWGSHFTKDIRTLESSQTDDPK